MSGGLFSNSRDHGLSSDDDEVSGGLLMGDGYAQHSSSLGGSVSSSQNRHRGLKSRGHSSKSRSSLSSSRHTYSTQNSVSLADFDKEYVDIDDDDDDDRVRKGSRGDPRRKGRGKGGRSRPGVDWMSEVTKLLLKSSKWKLAAVGLALGLLCAVTHQSYVWIKSERSSSGNRLSYLFGFV